MSEGSYPWGEAYDGITERHGGKSTYSSKRNHSFSKIQKEFHGTQDQEIEKDE